MATKLENLSGSEVLLFCRHGICVQPISIDSSWKCMAMMRYPGNTWPYDDARLHLSGSLWLTVREISKKLLADKCQHYRRLGTHSDGQKCNLVAYCIWPCFILLHYAAYLGGCVTIGLDQYLWVYNALTHHKAVRIIACPRFLQGYAVEGDNYLCRVFAGDDNTWIHHFTATNKRFNMEWKHLHLTREEVSGDTNFGQNAGHHLLGVVECAVDGRTGTLPHQEARKILPRECFPVF